MDNPKDPSQNASPFVLQTQQESTAFRSKSDDIFGSLGGLEQKYQVDLTQRKADDKKRSHDEDEDGDDAEGCFKKPNRPSFSQARGSDSRETGSDVSRESRSEGSSSNRNRDHYRSSDRAGGRSSYRDYDSRRRDHDTFFRPARGRGRFHQPDYKLNPDKYKKYSLEDTCMYGDTFNRNVAMDFISELRKRKNAEKMDDSEKPMDGCSKIEFHKPTSTEEPETEESSEKRKNYGSVYRMSEYVVGSAKKPKSKHHTKIAGVGDGSTISKSNLPLDHLAGEDLNTDEPIDTAAAKSDQSDSSKDSKLVSSNQSAAEKEDSVVESTSDGVPETKKGDEQMGVDQTKSQFKFGKGKGKRKIRARQTDDD